MSRYHPGRSGYAWQQARKKVLENAQICHICGEEIDFDAPPRSPRAPSVDHLLPLHAMRELSMAEQRRLALDPRGLRAAHFGCNAKRGAGKVPKPRKASRSW